jgi:hypothetical protein
VGWFLLLPLLIIPTLVILCFYLWRKAVDGVATWIRPGWVPVLPPDSWHLASLNSEIREKSVESSISNSKCCGNIAFVVSVREKISIEEVRQAFRTKLLDVGGEKGSGERWKHWKLRMVPKKFFGFAFWTPIKGDPDLSQHIWEKDDSKSCREFNDFAIDWISNGYQGRPLWEVIVSTPQTGKYAGTTVILTKIHHVIGVTMNILYS